MPAPLTTVVGNLTADPELRYTQGGHAVANFTIAATERVRVGEQWQDGNTVFLRCTVWRDYAEHVAGSLAKGVQVIATGSLTQRSYDHTDGSKRTVVEFDVQDVGPALRFATAAVTRTGTAAAAADGWADSDATPSRARAAATRAA